MPIGLSWPKYFALIASSMYLMSLGAQTVHGIYKPLDDLPDYVDEYRKRKLEELAKEKTKSNLPKT